MNSYFIFCASDFYLSNVTALASSLKYAVTSIPLFLLTVGKSLDEQTLGRSGSLYDLLAQGYQTFAYGSTEVTLGYSMETYFVRLSLELSSFAVLLYVNNHSGLTRGSRYCALFMVFEFFNLITADSISVVFAWVLFNLTIGFFVYFSNVLPIQRHIERSLCRT